MIINAKIHLIRGYAMGVSDREKRSTYGRRKTWGHVL